MSFLSRKSALFVVPIFAVACGNSVVVTGSGGSGTTGSGKTTGVTSASGTTGTGNACSMYSDQKGSGSLTVRFVNQSGVPVYLPQSCGQLMFDIKEIGGADMPDYVFDHSCLQTCHDLQTQSPIACGACAPASRVLKPGGTLDVTWEGTGLKSGVAMPSACYLMPETTCSEIVAAPPGMYQVTATGYAMCGNGTCACDATGLCQGSANGPSAQATPATVSFPSQGIVQVTFPPCAFGCAGG